MGYRVSERVRECVCNREREKERREREGQSINQISPEFWKCVDCLQKALAAPHCVQNVQKLIFFHEKNELLVSSLLYYLPYIVTLCLNCMFSL
jgi:hypothetical protein